MVYDLFRALPGDRACLPPSPALLIADLTPASGRQDHTTSPSASGALVFSTISVHRIPLRVRDVRNAPLWDGTAGDIDLIWGEREAEYFCEGGWTTPKPADEAICPSG